MSNDKYIERYGRLRGSLEDMFAYRKHGDTKQVEGYLNHIERLCAEWDKEDEPIRRALLEEELAAGKPWAARELAKLTDQKGVE